MKRLLYWFGVLVFVLLALEITVRLMGFAYDKINVKDIQLVPDTSFFEPHNKYGYSMSPGSFQITQDGQLSWSSTQNSNGYRTTGDTNTIDKDDIWVFGCSFTYGWGLDDSLTYPFLLQKRLPEYSVKNFGVGGYGTIHSLLQFEDELAKNENPKIVVIGYSHLHNQRNVADRFWLKAITSHKKLRGFNYPFARLEDDTLSFHMTELDYTNYNTLAWLRFASFVEFQVNRYYNLKLKEEQVTEKLFSRIAQICSEKNIELYVCGLDTDTQTKEMLNRLKINGLKTFELGVNISDSTYNLQPLDPHPNEVANAAYSKAILTLINEK